MLWKKISVTVTSLDNGDNRHTTECPYCHAEYVVDWHEWPGSYWQPPEWDEHEVEPGCAHLVNVDTMLYVRYPKPYIWAMRIRARWLSSMLRMRLRRWWRKWF